MQYYLHEFLMPPNKLVLSMMSIFVKVGALHTQANFSQTVELRRVGNGLYNVLMFARVAVIQ